MFTLVFSRRDGLPSQRRFRLQSDEVDERLIGRLILQLLPLSSMPPHFTPPKKMLPSTKDVSRQIDLKRIDVLSSQCGSNSGSSSSNTASSSLSTGSRSKRGILCFKRRIWRSVRRIWNSKRRIWSSKRRKNMELRKKEM